MLWCKGDFMFESNMTRHDLLCRIVVFGQSSQTTSKATKRAMEST